MAGQIAMLYEEGFKVPRPTDLSRLAKAVAKGEKLKGRVEMVFCSDEKVREMNKAYRGLDKVTDVLSFEWHEDDFAGEIYIACPQAKLQAPRYNNTYFQELQRLVVHGMLHLCGHDHMKAGERKLMRGLEDVYLKGSGVTL